MYFGMSKIPADIWMARDLTDNVGESQHKNIYREGKDLTILGGVLSGEKFDLQNTRAHDIQTRLGIRSSYRSMEDSERLANNIRRTREFLKFLTWPFSALSLAYLRSCIFQKTRGRTD